MSWLRADGREIDEGWSLDPPPNWTHDALCAQVDTEIFFPDKGGSVREGKRVCRECPVRAECLAYAIEHEDRYGIWGGLSERERRRLRDWRLGDPLPPVVLRDGRADRSDAA